MSVDFGQWFTPPKSKTPWTAMTAGSTNKNFKGTEQWGPLINSIMKIIPVVGPFLSVGGGLMGMEGRNTGFQGTDYGWKGNTMPMISGGMSGLYSNPVSGVIKGAGGYWDKGKNIGYNTTYDRSLDPNGKNFNWSQLGSLVGNVGGNYLGSNVWGNIGSRLGSRVGSNVNNKNKYNQLFSLIKR